MPLALIMVLGIAVSNFWPTVQSAILGYATNTSINGLLLETNNQRVAAGVGKLALNSQLNAAAQAKADDMAARDYWSHNTPEGNPPWTFIKQTGYNYTAAGENLAYGFDSSSATVAGWMGSPSHKQNMLASGYAHAGFGIANSVNFQGNGQQTIVVAMYATPVVVEKPTSQPPAVASQEPSQPSSPAPTQEPKAEPEPKPEPTSQPASEPEPIASEQPSQPNDEKEPEPQQIARLELISGTTAGWAVVATTLIAIAAAGVFLFRHSIFWHRAIVKGEKFIIKHHFLDIVLVVMAVAALVLVQTAGIIH